MELITEVKHLMVDADLYGKGAITILADQLNLNPKSLSMALTGYRKGPGSIKMLEQVKEHLLSHSKSNTSH